jgi:hypothetical protein
LAKFTGRAVWGRLAFSECLDFRELIFLMASALELYLPSPVSLIDSG